MLHAGQYSICRGYVILLMHEDPVATNQINTTYIYGTIPIYSKSGLPFCFLELEAIVTGYGTCYILSF